MFDDFFLVLKLERAGFQELVLDLHACQNDIVGNRVFQNQANAAAIFRNKGDAPVQCFPRIVEGQLSSLIQHLPSAWVKAHNTIGQSDLPVARQAADAEDLPFVHIQVNPAQAFAGHIYAQIPDLQDLLFRCLRPVSANAGRSIDPAPYHKLRNLRNRKALSWSGANQFAVF